MKIYIVVLSFIGFDIITGIVKALYTTGLNSTILRKGLFHKLSEILAVGGSGWLEMGTQYIDLGVSLPLLNCTSIYVCIMELISIMENLAEVNPELKKLFQPFLEKLKNKE